MWWKGRNDLCDLRVHTHCTSDDDTAFDVCGKKGGMTFGISVFTPTAHTASTSMACVSTEVLWWSYGGPMVVLWWSCGGPMVVLWWSYGGPMVVLWWSYGGPMVVP